MSIVRVTPDDVETFTIITTPKRTYSSSSLGTDGSVKLYARLSGIEKETSLHSSFNDSNANAVIDLNFDTAVDKIVKSAATARATRQPITGDLTRYLDLVSSASLKEQTVLDVERFTPTTSLTKYTLIKNNVKDVLMPYYRAGYPHAHWAYTNYHALNFFTAGANGTLSFPTASVLLYPNVPDVDLPGQTDHVSGSYCLTGAFSFDFHINPRYRRDGIDAGHFKAGTVFHLSSSYAVSLITGSRKDENGEIAAYRLQLQLSQSADVPPSLAVPGSYPNDLVFLSDDNSLSHNTWHHVVIRWGTHDVNYGTGSFIVDGVNRGNFVVPSGTISPRSFVGAMNPDVLCVGNFYEGRNTASDAMALFFDPDSSRRDGLYQLTDTDASASFSYRFNHPLKAEIHDVVFRRYFMSDAEVAATGSRGPGLSALKKDEIAFYLPPFFVEATPIKRFVGDHGGVPQTPFFEIDGTTDDPFNVAMAFGVGGHYINLDNFVKDFSTGRFPRLLNLTASMINHTTDAIAANVFLYSDTGVAKRNLTVLPCDDGTFDPNYEILTAESLQNKYTDPYGNVDISYINLDGLLSMQSAASGGLGPHDPDSETHQDMSKELLGATPEYPGLPPGPAMKTYIKAVQSAITASGGQDYAFDRGVQAGVPLTIFQRTLDPSSNQVTFFNISNLYYGSRILPGSLTIADSGISGSRGGVSITLKDDGYGNLYRADSNGAHATQNSVGNVFYDEGVIVVKSPHLYFFGSEQYDLNFKGVRNVFSTKYEVLAPSGMINSSSNITYSVNKDSLAPSGLQTDTDTFVYISGLYFHDENMNVVAKAKLAQPVIKRSKDKILFKVAIDS